jgi:hypothetical protein
MQPILMIVHRLYTGQGCLDADSIAHVTEELDHMARPVRKYGIFKS